MTPGEAHVWVVRLDELWEDALAAPSAAEAERAARFVNDTLPFPIRSYGGVDDANLGPEHLEAWAAQTTGGFALRLFPGGHFYYQTCAAEFRAALEADLG